MRTCKICNQSKPLTEFYQTVRNGSPYGYHGKCKSCYVKKQQENYDPIKKRDENLKRVYGIGIEEYNTLLEKQNNRCAICESTDPKGRKSGRGGGVDVFYVDHDHKTGNVRGLLCNICNRTMGYVGENSNVLEEMIKYLQKHATNTNTQ
jgi:hypothetical protein